jgi:uncharacterized membrane protein YidH (DUF202 family)
LDAGLARERTTSAWTRTALALTANSGLVLVRHERAFPMPVSVLLAGLSLLVAGLVLGYAARRSRIERLPDHEIVPPTAILLTLGSTVSVLCLATAGAIVVWH